MSKNGKPGKEPKVFLRGKKKGIRRPIPVSGPLLDWYYVYTGVRGVTSKGVYELWDAPVGIRLAVQEADKSDPILVPEMPWEVQFDGHLVRTVWQEGGRYHMYYSASYKGGIDFYLCYAYSDDAYHWTRPNLGIYNFQGSTENNIMLSGTNAGHFFEDPSAHPKERYKFLSQVNSIYTGPRAEIRGWMGGFYSGDRLHWKQYNNILLDFHVDTENIAYYDEKTQTYVGYLRDHTGGRRCVGRTETKDFLNWPMHRVVFQPDPQDEPDVSFYQPTYCKYPGRDDLHLMFPSVYHQITDHLDIQLAVSHDGWNWYRPERKAIIPVGPPGSGETGSLYACAGLQVLPDGRWGLAYGGIDARHNEEGDRTGMGRFRWARWQPDRLVGIEAPTEGRFTIRKTCRQKSELRLNYRCKPTGWITVELISSPRYPRPDVLAWPGYSFEDCDILTGDELSRVVTWRGKSDISVLGETVAVRLKMFQATVFAYYC